MAKDEEVEWRRMRRLNSLDVFIIAYPDDILVYSRILKEYQLYISKVLEYLGVRDLRLKPKKYKFYTKKVNYLGFIIG